MASSWSAPDSAVGARLLQLVARGQARSRTDLARLLSLAPSTVSLRVQALLAAGVLTETGDGPSQGGRRPRLLSVNAGAGHVLMADLGSQHARIGAMDIGGGLLAVEEVPLRLADGPAATIAALATAFAELTGRAAPPGRLLGIGVGIPGPVDVTTGSVTLPSRMPNWRGFAIQDALAQRFGVPIVVDNDANLMAVGESRGRERISDHLVVVKAGAGIGTGVISGGVVHRGAAGVAGDISHVRVGSGGTTPCSCGNLGCLETVASGAALVRELRASGIDVASTADVVAHAQNAEPTVITAVRRAGAQLGEVLATVTNFFNPHAVLLGGMLSTSEAFVAAVRSALYERCLPLATRALEIERVRAGADAGLLGAGLLCLDAVLDAALHTVPDAAPPAGAAAAPPTVPDAAPPA